MALSVAPSAPSFLSSYWIVLILLSIWSNLSSAVGPCSDNDKIYGIEVVNEFPHDRNSFTEGLLYAGNNTLFESTGLYGQSSVRRVALGSGKVEAINKMPRTYFGEGLTLLGDRLFQVNWKIKTGFIYDRNNLSKIGTFMHQMLDGWGLATDGNILFGSDGSSTLYHIDLQTLKVVEKHVVKYNGRQVYSINELEYVNGEVWANVWQLGQFISRLLFYRERLIAGGNMGVDVLNGIAWDQEHNRVFVTGKLWPKLYEIKVQPMEKPLGDNDIERLCMPPPEHFTRR